MMKRLMHNKKPGFTFIELILAITIMGIMFSLVLTVIVGMLRILDTMVRDIKFGTLLTPSGFAKSNVVCIKKSDSTLIKYSQDTNAIFKTVYSFDAATSPTNCPDTNATLPDTIQIKSGPSKISLDRMNVFPGDFTFTKASGSKPRYYNTVSSLVINFRFFTGNPINSDGNIKCLSNDIYCSSLQLNTAVSLRENSQ